MADLVVVGSGPGGVAAALTGARLGAAVTLAERGALGGVCVQAGCIPTSAYHRSVEAFTVAAGSAGLGVSTGPPSMDWERMHVWVSSVVNGAVARTRSALDYAGVQVSPTRARLVGGLRVEVGDRVFDGTPVVLACGARSVLPDLPGRPAAEPLTNEGAMSLSAAPASLVVLGAGRFGIEWADVFSTLGSQVTVVAPGARLLPAEDADLAGFLQMVLEERGVRFLLGTGVDEVDGATVVAGGQRVDAARILSADARAANVDDLGLEDAGVALGEHGGIEVDAGSRTTAEGVYAAGDVTGPPWLSNRARQQGEVAATNALGGSAKVRPERIPRSVNTYPPLAAVGYTEEEAAARGVDVGVGYGDLAGNLKALTLGEPRGALKLVVDRSFGEILGAHMVGEHAEEVIAQLVLAMEAELDYRDLARAAHLHPSLAELVTEAARSVQ